MVIAVKNGCKVYTNNFKSFGDQRNWALDNCENLNSWILFIDADEHSTKSFRQAVETTCTNSSEIIAGYYLCNRLMYGNKWLKRTGHFPTWQFRLLRRGRARFCDFGHGQKEAQVDGQLGYIKEPYLHYPFSKGWTIWWERHNRYSSQEAVARCNNKTPFYGIWSLPPTIRNAAMRSWLSRFWWWPPTRFIISYLFRGCFLEGYAGFVVTTNWAIYEYIIWCKIKELQDNNK